MNDARYGAHHARTSQPRRPVSTPDNPSSVSGRPSQSGPTEAPDIRGAKTTALLRHAGFERVTVETQERTATHHDVRTAVAGQLDALPSGSITDQLEEKQRNQPGDG